MTNTNDNYSLQKNKVFKQKLVNIQCHCIHCYSVNH